MDARTRRTLLKDAGVVTSVALLVLVGLSALTGAALDEVGEVLPIDDLHALTGYALAMTAGIHALAHLGALRAHASRRMRYFSGGAPRRSPADSKPSCDSASREGRR